MPGTARNRTDTQNEVVIGSTTGLPSPPGTTGYATVSHWEYRHRVTDDVVGNRTGVNAFKTRQQFRQRGCYTGDMKNTSGVKVRTFDNWPCAHNPSQPNPESYFPTLTSLELSNFAWDVAAKTNPSVAPLNATQMIGELRDLPQLVKGWGGNLIRKVAQGHLSWRFAIKPMISDFVKILDFQKTVQQRFNWLKKLSEGKVLRRRCSLRDQEIKTTPGNVLLQSQFFGHSATMSTYAEEKIWASIEWKLKFNSFLKNVKDDAELMRLARRTVLGINRYGVLKATWDLLPWTWLSDWFYSIGDILDATNNQLELSSGNICLMRTRSARYSYQIGQLTNGVAMSAVPAYKTIVKERSVISAVIPPVPAGLPTLTGGQLSILADLAVLRGSPR